MYIVIYYVNIVKTIWYVLKSTMISTLKYKLYFYYGIDIMIMIERTTQNKIAKNDLWDYGVEKRGGANSDSNVSAKAAVQDSNQT